MSRRWLAALTGAATVLAAGLVVFGVQGRAWAAEFYPVPAGGVYTIDGHGYGHGHGMSQWGAQGAALSGKGAGDILAFYYPATYQQLINNPTLRVQLTATASGDIRVDSTTGYAMTIQDQASGVSREVPDGSYRVLTSGSRQSILQWTASGWAPLSIGGSGSYTGPLTFSTADGVTVFQPSGIARNYRGTISVVATGAATSVAVNNVTMEDYLLGVVPRESPAWFEPAALQAQAVAARSYAWWDKQTPSSASWDICDTTACQVYGGRSLYSNGTWTAQEYATSTDAVRSTVNIALYYNNAPAFTQFSSSNGGEASAGSQPYLAAFADPYDGIPPQNTNHDWTASLSAASLQASYPSVGTLTGIRITSREGAGEWGGYITGVQLVGTGGTVTPSSARFGLKSTWWKPRAPGNPFGDINSAAAINDYQARFQGWTIDPDTTDPLAVHAYVDGLWGGAFTADVSRPDVGAAYPGMGDAHGFDFVLTMSGQHTVCLYAINVGTGDTNTKLGCQVLTVGHLPQGDVNSAVVANGQVRVQGWAFDQDRTTPIDVHVYVNGTWAAQATADVPRRDVLSAFPEAGRTEVGYDVSVPVPAGRDSVCIYAIDPAPGAVNPLLGCRTVTRLVNPVGDLNLAVGRGTTIDVSGWALDPDTSDPIAVHLYVDGRWTRAVTADGMRNDVAAAYPGSGNLHGFAASLPATQGQHQVCAYAINVGAGTVNPLLGCAQVEVGTRPIGDINGVQVTGLQAQLTGWALQNGDTRPLSVHVYVDGRWRTAVTANLGRPDVAAAYPGAGVAHGYSTTVAIGVGSHQICLYAIGLDGSGVNPLIGCRTVTVPATAADPQGNLDGVIGTGGHITASGWAIDPDVLSTSIWVDLYVDGQWSAHVLADGNRPDVGTAYPGAGSAHGFSIQVPATPGGHKVCVYGINQGQGTTNPLLSCQNVTVTG